MRKIKITALLLAVLMIVTAFAGCASKSTVTNLDNKVNDIEGELTDIKGTLSKIEEALGKIETPEINVDEIVDKVKEELGKDDESGDDIPDDTGATTDVATEIAKAGAIIDDLKGDFEDNKANYTAEDIDAVRKAFGEAQATISACKKVEDVQAALDKLMAELAAHKAVNAVLYDYIVALKGNITDDAKETVEAAEAALKAAKKFYKYDDSTVSAEKKEPLTDYEYAEDKTIHLVDVLEDLFDAYHYTLPQIKREADALEKTIDEITPELTFPEVTEIVLNYNDWAKRAAKLSETLVALVENKDELLAAQKSALNALAAGEIFAKEKVESTLIGANFGKDVPLFDDYITLVNNGANEQVVFIYKTKDAAGDEVYALTSGIYAAIDAKIEAWAEEYELTAEAVEYIVKEKFGGGDDLFYAKYNADKALVKAFEAEYEKLADGTFAAIKALNSKKLAADAIDVVTAYKKNAEDIDAWQKALKEAYAEELKNDKDINGTADRNINNNTKYADALLANFNAYVVKAELCEYLEDTKTFKKYNFEFLTKIDVKKNETEAYYHNLYDFDSAELALFLTGAYRDAQKAANAINLAVKNFTVEDEDSIKDLLVNIGGYVKYNATPAFGKAHLEAIDAVAIDTKLFDADRKLIAMPATIAEFIYAYKTVAPYDLSSLIDTAAYDAKLAAIEAQIKDAQAALSEVNDAYVALLDGNRFAIVNMETYGTILNLHSIFAKWTVKGWLDMQVATVVNTTADGVKEYRLTPINEGYDYMTDAVLNPENGEIINLRNAARYLNSEAGLVVDAYTMLDKIKAFGGSFAYNDMGGKIDTIVQAAKGTAATLKYNGVVSVTVSEAMTADGVDATGAEYKKGERLWTVEYVTFSAGDSRQLDTNLITAKFALYNVGDNVNNIPQEIKDEIAKRAWVSGTAAVATVDEIYTEVFETIPEWVRDMGTLKAMYDAFKALNGKMIANYQLPALAMALEAKFLIDNGASYDAITTAKANFDPALGGYGFNYIKGMTAVALKVANVSDTTIRDALGSNVTTLSALKLAVKAIETNSSLTTIGNISFGAADINWMSAELDIENNDCTFTPDDATWAEIYDAETIVAMQNVAGIIVH